MSLRTCLLTKMKGLARETDGSILPLFALTIASVSMLSGVTADFTMFISERMLVQHAADGAALSAARLNDVDSKRVEVARAFFHAHLPPKLTSKLSNEVVAIDGGSTRISVGVDMSYKGVFGGLTNVATLQAAVKSQAVIAKPTIRQLDLVMCVDATGSMSNTLAAVKSNALDFEKNMNDEIAKRGIAPFEAMRVRVIYYRDYAGSYTGDTLTTWVWDGSRWVYKSLKSTDAEFWNHAGDNPPLKPSSFFPLPTKRTDFSNFVSPESASGGGDTPESGLECVNEALNSPWAKIGDAVPGNAKPLDAVFPVIVVWTDAAAHKAGYAPVQKNPVYPAVANMPRTTEGLRAKWMNPAIVDQYRKLLVFFGNPSVSQSDQEGVATGWADVKTWPNFVIGGTLTQGNQQMVSRIADAIATKIPSPYLSN